MAKLHVIEDNREKSQRGAKFEKEVETFLKRIGVKFKTQPKYGGQFNPDFVIDLPDSKIIVDCTTTARSDRIKQKQFDAHGIKKLLPSSNVLFIVVIENIEGKEKDNFVRAKKRIKLWKDTRLINYIDEILSCDEFRNFLESLINPKNVNSEGV